MDRSWVVWCWCLNERLVLGGAYLISLVAHLEEVLVACFSMSSSLLTGIARMRTAGNHRIDTYDIVMIIVNKSDASKRKPCIRRVEHRTNNRIVKSHTAGDIENKNNNNIELPSHSKQNHPPRAPQSHS
jgi:hypothetical protein